MSKGMCSAPECVDEAARDGLCWHHHRQRATGQVMKPKSEAMAHKLTPWGLLTEAMNRWANAKDVDESDYEAASDLVRKHATTYGQRRHRERIREGMAKAKAGGKHVGRPPSVEDQEVAEIAREVGIRRAAKLLGVSRGTVRRAMRRAEHGPGPKGNLVDPPPRGK